MAYSPSKKKKNHNSQLSKEKKNQKNEQKVRELFSFSQYKF